MTKQRAPSPAATYQVSPFLTHGISGAPLERNVAAMSTGSDCSMSSLHVPAVKFPLTSCRSWHVSSPQAMGVPRPLPPPRKKQPCLEMGPLHQHSAPAYGLPALLVRLTVGYCLCLQAAGVISPLLVHLFSRLRLADKTPDFVVSYPRPPSYTLSFPQALLSNRSAGLSPIPLFPLFPSPPLPPTPSPNCIPS